MTKNTEPRRSRLSGGKQHISKCYIKMAKEVSGKINEETIKLVMDMRPYICDFVEFDISKHAGYTTGLIYLASHCEYFKSLLREGAASEMGVIHIANLVQTLDFPSDVFSDCLGLVPNSDSESFFDYKKYWEVAKTLPKGLACRAFCRQKTHFCNPPESNAG